MTIIVTNSNSSNLVIHSFIHCFISSYDLNQTGYKIDFIDFQNRINIAIKISKQLIYTTYILCNFFLKNGQFNNVNNSDPLSHGKNNDWTNIKKNQQPFVFKIATRIT